MFTSSSAIQINMLFYTLFCSDFLYLPFQSCPSSQPSFFRPWETWIAFRPGTYSCLGDNCSLLLKPCLCYAVYLMILLKLQYCYFNFFSSVLHYLNCCTWYWKLEDCYQFRKRVLNGKRLRFWLESSEHLNAWVTLLPWVVSLTPMGPAMHGGAHVCAEFGENRFCCKSSGSKLGPV